MAKYSEEKIQEVVTLYLSGKSQKEVSEITGISVSTLKRARSNAQVREGNAYVD